MYNKKKTLIVSLLLILLVFSNIFFSTSVASEPIIGEDDVYHKDVEMGNTGSFKWTVYKNSTKNYVVTVSVKGFEQWSQKIDSSYFVISEDNPYELVTLNFEVPDYPEKEKRNTEVTFTFRQINQTEKFHITKTAQVNVRGITPTGEANTLIGGFTNPLPPPLNVPIGAFMLNIVIWIVLSFIIYFLIKTVLISLVRKTETKLDDRLIELIQKPVLLLLILYGIIHSVLKLNIKIGFRATIYQVYTLLVVIIGIYVAIRIFEEVLREVTARKGGKSSTFGTVLKPLFEKIGLVLILVGGLIFGLNIIGVEITALLAGAGVVGLVIAFAAQDTLSNFFSGMHLLLDRPFQMGDLILLEGGEYCRVESIGMRSTKLYSIFDHDLIILPNNSIANQKIINLVKPDTKIRNRVEVGVAYRSNLKKVTEILYDAAIKHPNVIKKEGYEPLVRFTEFGDSSLKFMVIFWVDDIMNQWTASNDIRHTIDEEFRKQNITIPFPQRTIWLNEVNKTKEKENK
ncbi:MAG: mechanosensitive ion channel domain-containing protein [Candidatus Thermoplasmatota archaeon]